MLDNISDEYPYGKFPTEYTKQGQAVLMQKFLNPSHDTKPAPPQPDTVETFSHSPSVSASDNENSAPPNSEPRMDIHKLMPLIKSMSQNKSISQNELLKMMLPMLSGGNGEYNELISMMIDKNSQEKDLVEKSIEENPNKPKISSFRRVE